MAKNIKVIKCPQCGSVDKTELKPDHYRCENCRTEYFLDSDDIHIHHRHYNVGNTSVDTDKQKKLAAISAILIIVVVFGIFLLNVLFSSRSSRTSSAFQKDKEKWSYQTESGFFTDAAGNPLYYVFGHRENVSAGDKDAGYLGVYDAITRKQKQLMKTPITYEHSGGSDFWDYRQFDDGNVYVILKKSKLYRLDRQQYVLKEVLPQEYESQPALRSGIANIVFVYEQYGAGFKVMNNEGNEYYWYPIPGKVYNQDEFYKAQNAIHPTAKRTTRFEFSDKRMGKENDPITLIKYSLLYAPGYPTTKAYFNRGDEEGTKFNARFPNEESGSFGIKYISEGRRYFSPSVVVGDDSTVLIQFKNTAVENSLKSIQLLNSETGQILWTVPMENESIYLYHGVKTKDGYFVNGNICDFFITNDGKQTILKKEEL